jgi:hypothetical protein
MDSPRLQNDTEFLAEPRLLAGKQGEELVVIVKATFLAPRGSGELELAPAAGQRAIRGADLPWGEPEKSSIKYPSDLCISKPGTDVIVVAAAHAPEGRPVPTFDAGIRVGSLKKIVRVFGLRVWESSGAGLSAPRPTTGIELRYDYAWGGADLSDPAQPLEEPRNPVGMGIVRDPSQLTHQPAPYIEEPAEPIRSARSRPTPAGVGAIGRHWEPRRRLLGTYDARWLEERAPLLPDDHDERGNLCASPGLVSTTPLAGGEEVGLWNLTPGGGGPVLQLPKVRVSITLTCNDRERLRRTPPLDTVLVDTVNVAEGNDVLIELCWRAAFKPPRRLKDAELVVREEAPS